MKYPPEDEVDYDDSSIHSIEATSDSPGTREGSMGTKRHSVSGKAVITTKPWNASDDRLDLERRRVSSHNQIIKVWTDILIFVTRLT
jgi:hypothetical protein